MKLIVNPHKIEIDKSPVNEREIDITKCEFEFAEEITSEYVKEAYFTFKGTTYKEIIANNECSIPNEVLEEKGQIEIGVVAYLVSNDEEIKRYNPSPAYFNTWVGSLKDDVENTEPITPSEMEQFEQALNDGLIEVNGKLDDINTAIEETNNLNINVSKLNNITTVALTKKDSSVQTVQILDGLQGETGEQGIPGPKGEQGEPGKDGAIQYKAGSNVTITDDVISVDLSNYYNKNEVNDLITSAIGDVLGGSY